MGKMKDELARMRAERLATEAAGNHYGYGLPRCSAHTDYAAVVDPCPACRTMMQGLMIAFRGKRTYTGEPFGMPRWYPLERATRIAVGGIDRCGPMTTGDFVRAVFGVGEILSPGAHAHRAGQSFVLCAQGFVKKNARGSVTIERFETENDGLRIAFDRIARWHISAAETADCLVVSVNPFPTLTPNRVRFEFTVYDMRIGTSQIATYLVALTPKKGLYVAFQCRESLPPGREGDTQYANFASKGSTKRANDEKGSKSHEKCLAALDTETTGPAMMPNPAFDVEAMQRLAGMGKNEKYAHIYGAGDALLAKARAKDQGLKHLAVQVHDEMIVAPPEPKTPPAPEFHRFVTFQQCGHVVEVDRSDSAFHTVVPGVEDYQHWNCKACGTQDWRTVVRVEDRYPDGPRNVRDGWSAAVKAELARREDERRRREAVPVQTEDDADTDNWWPHGK